MNMLRKIPTLQTPRMLLRPYRLEDAKDIYPLANDKDIATNTENLPYPYTLENAEDWIRAHPGLFAEGRLLNLAVVQKKKNIMMGAIGLEMDFENNHAELGYWLGKPFWGQGFATEAARRLMHFAFETMKFHRVFSVHIKRNNASGRVLQKLGMTYEGCLRQQLLKFGQYEDLMHYGILRSEYRKMRI